MIAPISTLAVSHGRRLNQDPGASQTGCPFTATGTDRISKGPLLRPSTTSSLPSKSKEGSMRG